MSTTSRQRSAKQPTKNTRKRLVSVDGPGRNRGLIPVKPVGLFRAEEPAPTGGASGKADHKRAPGLRRENVRNAKRAGADYKFLKALRTKETTTEKAAA